MPAMLTDPSFEDPFATASVIETPRHITASQQIVTGTSALGAAMLLERGAGFVANVLAARLAGISTFGAYALAIGTANSISTYAAGGIGATATRFSGKYRYGTLQYATLGRVLAIISLASALIGGTLLHLGATPIARLLHKPQAARIFRWAAWSVAGIILVECARGFFVGQHRLRALLTLSLLVGTGMLLGLVAAAATHSSVLMIASQAAVTLCAVAVCVALAKPLGLRSSVAARVPIAPMLREVTSFGVVQMSGLVSTNLAGWWLTAVIARSDTTLAQVGFFAVASQLRSFAGLLPGLLTEGSYATMAGESMDKGGPRHIMAVCTFAATAASLTIALVGAVVVPWLLPLVYGRAFADASLVTVLGLAVAVVHMGNAPAAARLSILSVRTTAAINTAWALFVGGLATWLFFRGGTAAHAMTVFFAAHLLSASLVLISLIKRGELAPGMVALFTIGSAAVVVAAVVSWMEKLHRIGFAVGGGLMVVLLLGVLAVLSRIGRAQAWIPRRETIGAVLRPLKLKVTRPLAQLLRGRTA